MRKQALIPLMIGLVVGLVALKLGYDYLANAKKSPVVNKGPVKRIVVASRDLAIGEQLTTEDLSLVDMPQELVPAGVFTDVEALVGETLRKSLSAKMPLLGNMIGPGAGLQGMIPEGYRAMAVKIDEYSGVAGLLQPGNFVDVVGTVEVKYGNSNKKTTISKLVLQNVEVRAVGAAVSEETAAGKVKGTLSRSVTLLVKADDMERLQFAKTNSKLSLALRPAMDDRSVFTTGVTVCKLLTPSSGSAFGTKVDDMLGKFVGMAFKRSEDGQTNTTDQSKSGMTLAGLDARAENPGADPYVVEVITGGRTERIYFASEDSDCRVGSSSGRPLEQDTNGKAMNVDNDDSDLSSE